MRLKSDQKFSVKSFPTHVIEKMLVFKLSLYGNQFLSEIFSALNLLFLGDTNRMIAEVSLFAINIIIIIYFVSNFFTF